MCLSKVLKIYKIFDLAILLLEIEKSLYQCAILCVGMVRAEVFMLEKN